MKSRAVFFLSLAAFSVPSYASVTLRFDGTGLGRSIDYVYKGNNKTNFAGQMHFMDLTHNMAITMFCVDLDHFISGGQTYNTNEMPTLGDATYGKAGSVFANSYAGVSSNNAAAALQIAIWATRYGGNLATNSGGNFQLQANWYNNHGSIIAMAQSMVNLGLANPKNALYYKADPLASGQGQLGPVPEPVSLTVATVGLLGLLRRRKA